MKAPGKGSTRHPLQASPRIVVSFDEETFSTVRKRAVIHKTSFAEQVRLLVEWGLEADRASEVAA